LVKLEFHPPDSGGVSSNSPQNNFNEITQDSFIMEKKESYRQHLPHFQQAGQAYFVTWCLKDAVPPKALENYSIHLKQLHSQIDFLKNNKAEEKAIRELRIEFSKVRKKYMKAFDDLLHLQTKFTINLSKEENTRIVLEALCFWDKKRIENYAICVMPNHVHWVFRTFEKDEEGKPVYLQDILQSVKRFSANQLNNSEHTKGTVWQRESYDTTIRDDLHLYNAINYTLDNPVVAGLVRNWWEWKGTMFFPDR